MNIKDFNCFIHSSFIDGQIQVFLSDLRLVSEHDSWQKSLCTKYDISVLSSFIYESPTGIGGSALLALKSSGFSAITH
jgi:hypothetical protein